MRTIRSVLVVVVIASGLGSLGATAAGASAPDIARVTSVQVSATSLQVGDVFSLTAGAQDRVSTDYVLTFVADWSGLSLGLGAVSCEGSFPDSPSADGPACEFDSFTTTTRTTTHITGTFQVTASTPTSFSITMCAASFTNPPDPFPGCPNTAGGNCKTRFFTVR